MWFKRLPVGTFLTHTYIHSVCVLRGSLWVHFLHTHVNTRICVKRLPVDTFLTLLVENLALSHLSQHQEMIFLKAVSLPRLPPPNRRLVADNMLWPI